MFLGIVLLFQIVQVMEFAFVLNYVNVIQDGPELLAVFQLVSPFQIVMDMELVLVQINAIVLAVGYHQIVSLLIVQH